MALKKLHTEVDKALREVRACIDAYDERWQELLEFNRQFVERKDHLVDEAKKEVVRGKKYSVRTATLELVDYKHVNDAKAKIEADLEGALRKLHRLKQQLADWIHNYSDKDIRNKDTLTELRKSIELRYKRGRVFYSQGHSSQPNDHAALAGSARDAGRFATCEAAQWMTEFIDALSSQIDGWAGELAALEAVQGPAAERVPEAPVKKSRKRGGKEAVSEATSLPGKASSPGTRNGEWRQERIAQLGAMLDLHRLHVAHLERLLQAVCGEEIDEDDERLAELRDILEPYVHENPDLVVIVADDVYQELGLACCVDEGRDSSPRAPAQEANETADACREGSDEGSASSPRDAGTSRHVSAKPAAGATSKRRTGSGAFTPSSVASEETEGGAEKRERGDKDPSSGNLAPGKRPETPPSAASPSEPPKAASFGAAAESAMRLSPSSASVSTAGTRRASARDTPEASSAPSFASSVSLASLERGDEARHSQGLREKRQAGRISSEGSGSSPETREKEMRRNDASPSRFGDLAAETKPSSSSRASEDAKATPRSAAQSQALRVSARSACGKEEPRATPAAGAHAGKGSGVQRPAGSGLSPSEAVSGPKATQTPPLEDAKARGRPSSAGSLKVAAKARPRGYAEALISTFAAPAVPAAVDFPALSAHGASRPGETQREDRERSGEEATGGDTEPRRAPVWAPAGAWAPGRRSLARGPAGGGAEGNPTGQATGQAASPESKPVTAVGREESPRQTRGGEVDEQRACDGGCGRGGESHGSPERLGASESDARLCEGRSENGRRETHGACCASRGGERAGGERGETENEGRKPDASDLVAALTTESTSGWIYGYSLRAVQTGEPECRWFPPETPHVFLPASESIDSAVVSSFLSLSESFSPSAALSAHLSAISPPALERPGEERPPSLLFPFPPVSQADAARMQCRDGEGDTREDSRQASSPHARAASPFTAGEGDGGAGRSSGSPSLLSVLSEFPPQLEGRGGHASDSKFSSARPSGVSGSLSRDLPPSAEALEAWRTGAFPSSSPGTVPRATGEEEPSCRSLAHRRDGMHHARGEVCPLFDSFLLGSEGAAGATLPAAASLANFSSSPIASSSTHSGGAGSGGCCLGSPVSSKSSPCGVVTPQNRGGASGEPVHSLRSRQNPVDVSPPSVSVSEPGSLAALLPPGVAEDGASGVSFSSLAAFSSPLAASPSCPSSSLPAFLAGHPERRAASAQTHGEAPIQFASGSLEQPGSAGASTTFSDSARSSCHQPTQSSGGGREKISSLAVSSAGAASRRETGGEGLSQGSEFPAGQGGKPHAAVSSLPHLRLPLSPFLPPSGSSSTAIGESWRDRACLKCLRGVCTVVHIIPDEVEVRELCWSWHGELVDEGRESDAEGELQARDAEIHGSAEGEERAGENAGEEIEGRRLQVGPSRSLDAQGEGSEGKGEAERSNAMEARVREWTEGRKRGDERRSDSGAIFSEADCAERRSSVSSLPPLEPPQSVASTATRTGGEKRTASPEDPRDREQIPDPRADCGERGVEGGEEREAVLDVRTQRERGGRRPSISRASDPAPRVSRKVPVGRSAPTSCRGCATRRAQTLLSFEKGERVEVLVHHRQGWIFGRIRGQPHRRGWFPDYMLQRPEDVCTVLPIEDLACTQLGVSR
uniref:CCR4-NOT transcription complex, subunit 3,related n=1 Tax=Neospora caninum (strain Liverpool) TaxID=572307 RepID=A0A0F7UK20_NEOCL|nr:TPA: CCR4-NOT transcription complex, subunit 3,related [Neospora caninum Liverpool]